MSPSEPRPAPARHAWIPLVALALLFGAVALVGQGPIRQAPVKLPHPPPNLLLIVADDLGVDLVGAYGVAGAPPCTPSIDQLAEQGLLFRNAWADPVCSPTRAQLLTGRHGFRTGVGEVVGDPLEFPGLPLAETTLPEALSGYDSAAVGKWHLADASQGAQHPNQSGFRRFRGTLGNLSDDLDPPGDYFRWQSWEDGVGSVRTGYATSAVTDDALAMLGELQEPWFLQVAYHAPHTPRHDPPAELVGCPIEGRSPVPAMIEALDREIGRLLESVPPDTWVVFLGDNGSAHADPSSPFPSEHLKGTLYEGGVRVPLIVRGPGVVRGESLALVCATDVFATLCELAEVPSLAEDSVSMVPYLHGQAASLRRTLYAERFSPNGPFTPDTRRTRAIRGERYKLIELVDQPPEMYDLWQDPYESTNLIGSLTPEQQAAYEGLLLAWPR